MTSPPQRLKDSLLRFLLYYGCVVTVYGQNTTCCSPDSPGLESGDVAAIILGVILFLLLVITAIICYKKLCAKEEPDHRRVSPVITGFSISPEKLKCQTDSAIERGKLETQKQQGDMKHPIFYMDDDIYYPPKSRPLPSDPIVPNGYPVASDVVHAPPRPRHQRTGNAKKSRSRPKSRSPDHFDGLSRSSSMTLTGHLIFPDDGRINFTTHYKVPDSYC